MLSISIIAAPVLLALERCSQTVARDVGIVIWLEAKVIVLIPFAAMEFMQTLRCKMRDALTIHQSNKREMTGRKS